MFEIGWGELLIIGVVALIAIGPKELPTVFRTLGQWTNKLRRMASEFQSQFQEAMREAEMADLKKQVDTLTSSFDPKLASNLTLIIQGLVVLFIGADLLVLYVWQARRKLPLVRRRAEA